MSADDVETDQRMFGAHLGALIVIPTRCGAWGVRLWKCRVDRRQAAPCSSGWRRTRLLYAAMTYAFARGSAALAMEVSLDEIERSHI